MEKMPFHVYLDEPVTAGATMAVLPRVVSTAWRERLPILGGSMVTLRELELRDAPSLLAMLAVEGVGRVIAPPPTAGDGLGRMISWGEAQRRAGV